MLRSSLFLVLLFPQYGLAILSGWVQSPGYPRGYPPHASFNWSRCAPPGHVLTLALSHLDLEDSHDCDNDALQVMSDGVPISTLCGRQTFEELRSSVNPHLLSQSGGCLSLTFHSDFSNVRRHTGFRGFYTVRDFDECEEDPDHGCSHFCQNFIGSYRCSCRHGYQLDTDKQTCRVSCTEDRSGSMKGVISSPSHPAPYAENALCSYTLSVEDHLQLELTFSGGFDVEQGPDGQCVDSVTVETSSGSLGPFCGQTLPPSPLLTQSSHVRILFNSDDYGSNTGFSIHYKTRAQTCPALVTPHSSVSPERPEHSHGDTVTVTCELGRTLDITDEKTLSLTEFKTTCQRTGAWSPVYRCIPVNCGPPEVTADDILQVVNSGSISNLYGDEVQFECGSKYYTLEGDDRYICNASGEWVSVNGEADLPRCTEVCGKPEEDILSSGRIWGGKQAELGNIPWQLYIKDPKLGAASLINDGWAVTAAHVVSGSDATQLKMYGGLINTDDVERSQSDVVVMDVKDVIIHSGYVNPRPEVNFNNDIALLRLSSRVKLGPNLLPICLPEAGDSHVQENELGTVSGWGFTEERDVSKILKHATIRAYSLDDCKAVPMHKKAKKPIIFTEGNMFCAGESGQSDSCKGDSGGPFFMPPLGAGNKAGQGPYRLKGIVSWGSKCREQQFKGYYVNVGNYLDWIQETIERVEKEDPQQ